METLRPLAHPRRVYCAGPLFNAAERREMEQIAAHLAAAGWSTFVPHADGMEFAQLQPYLVSQGYDARAAGQLLHEAIFALDTYHVAEGCGALVFNLNGRVPDEGGVAELTMAWMLGKPVVLFKEDARSAISGRDNPMVVGQAAFDVVRRLADVADALEAAAARCSLAEDAAVPAPPAVAETVRLGRQFWRELERLGSGRPLPEVAALVLDLFAARRRVPS